MAFERELEVARQVTKQAAEVALRHWREGVSAETKPDDSPVTVADREVEQLITEAFAREFPEDGLLGEEGANRSSRSGRRWIIDPVDGTRDFMRGSRMWSVQLALEAGDEIVVGVCALPTLDETYYASLGGGAFLNGAPIHVSAITQVSHAVLCVNDLNVFHREKFGPGFIDWASRFWAIRNPGGSPDAMMVASGRAEAWIEPRSKAWDLAPHKIITEEAGGVFRNFDGGSSIFGGNCVTCVPALESELMRFVQSG